MCLLVGPQGVGKTLLLKRLQFLSGKDKLGDMEEAPATIPTVGTNLVNVQVGKKTDLTVRELGGSMGPIWHSYYKDCKLLLFMVDVSNAAQLSASTIQLLTTLTDNRLQDVSVLILLNKVDLPSSMTLTELKSLMRLEDIVCHAKQKVTVLEISAREGQGLLETIAWLKDHNK
ncbi:ADP-ribosylation factor-like protein 16 [Branchiostoma belcheri]|nr:ADP-ribosylation factor-like protein 16 [Branchiostoma belcheri]